MQHCVGKNECLWPLPQTSRQLRALHRRLLLLGLPRTNHPLPVQLRLHRAFHRHRRGRHRMHPLLVQLRLHRAFRRHRRGRQVPVRLRRAVQR